MALDMSSRFILHIKLGQLDCLAYHLTCYVKFLEDLSYGKVGHDNHYEALEIVAELPSCEYNF